MEVIRSASAQSLTTGLALATTIPTETAVALSYDGTAQAVLMATPADLEDFACGFSMTEGIATLDEIEQIAVTPVAHGIDLRIWLSRAAGTRYMSRRRGMVGPVGCGLCGLETLEAAMRAVPVVAAHDFVITAAQIDAALSELDAQQPMRDACGATHAAAFCVPGRGIVMLREDVGRHNALDKLAGGLMRQGIAASDGAVIMTSRLSVDLVQKCALLGAPALISLAAPTTAAIETALGAGIGLACRARSSARAEVYSHPRRFGLPETDLSG